MTDTRDELAEWLYAAINACESPDDVVTWVDRSLASGVLGNLRADAKAEGWAEAASAIEAELAAEEARLRETEANPWGVPMLGNWLGGLKEAAKVLRAHAG